MSEVVTHKKAIERSGRFREYREPLARLDFNDDARPAKVELGDGTVGRGTCLGCHDAPCMMLATADTAMPEALSEFPGDPAREVCPTRAVVWNDAGEAAVINADACIGCGLCIARCPYGAISLTREGTAVVANADPDGLTVPSGKTAEEAKHASATRLGRIGPMRSPALRQMQESIAGLNDLQSTQYVRNLLIGCGMECRTRRRGDTNVRMDGVVGLADGRLGVLEIELGNAVLESPRSLLEDVAVLHGRYGIDVKSIDPISVIVGLPNARSEYFQVIADIEKVLALRCRTVTVGALLAVLWHFERVDKFVGDLFMTSPGDTNLWPAMNKHLCEAIPESQPYPGTYRPSK